jgi:CRP/FNR family transcriptional regulator
MQDCLSDIQHQHAFDLLNESEFEILNKNKATVHYKKNDIILKQGTIANNIVFSKNGLYKLHIEGDQKNVILTLKGSQVFLGLSCLFYVNNTYLYTVTAIEDCEVDIYDAHSFKTVLNQNISFSNEIIKFLNHNSARIFKRFINMAEKNARGKVANMLICFANSLYNSDEFHLTLSRQELAEYLSLSMENIIRILKEFETDNLIEVRGKDIKIKDKEVLQKICNYG